MCAWTSSPPEPARRGLATSPSAPHPDPTSAPAAGPSAQTRAEGRAGTHAGGGARAGRERRPRWRRWRRAAGCAGQQGQEQAAGAGLWRAALAGPGAGRRWRCGGWRGEEVGPRAQRGAERRRARQRAPTRARRSAGTWAPGTGARGLRLWAAMNCLGRAQLKELEACMAGVGGAAALGHGLRARPRGSGTLGGGARAGLARFPGGLAAAAAGS